LSESIELNASKFPGEIESIGDFTMQNDLVAPAAFKPSFQGQSTNFSTARPHNGAQNQVASLRRSTRIAQKQQKLPVTKKKFVKLPTKKQKLAASHTSANLKRMKPPKILNASQKQISKRKSARKNHRRS
jgi:hypothetical protein